MPARACFVKYDKGMVENMTDLEKRYGKALKEIRRNTNLLTMPEEVKSILKATTDLETKTKMLEEIAKKLQVPAV